MNFASVEYLPFLLLVLALFQFVPTAARPLVLLLASYAFYLHEAPVHGLILAASTGLAFGSGLLLERSPDPRRRRAILIAAVLANLALLAYFKYSGFAARILDQIAGWFGGTGPTWPALILPLGISFYVFQALSYSIDVYRRRIPATRSPVDCALYLAFFPQLIAGPIERAGDLLPELRATRSIDLERFSSGSRLILWGLLKKSVLADRLTPLGLDYFRAPQEHGSLELLIGAWVMMTALYLDFSAYTDIARGSARYFGIELVRNFERTFLVRSNSQFWARWHMSLGRWIADYVYAPLARPGSSLTRLLLLDFLVMGLFGLWHGADWNFVLLGLLTGLLVAQEHLRQFWRRTRGGFRTRRPVRLLPGAVSWTLVMLANGLVLVLFFARDLPGALGYYRMLWPADGSDWLLPGQSLGLLGAMLALFGAHAAMDRFGHEARWRGLPVLLRSALLLCLVALWLRFRVPHSAPFFYFRF